MAANNLLSIADINVYMTCIFVYQCLHDNIPNFHNFYVYNSDIHAKILDKPVICMWYMVD